jgi:UDP-N-acetylmuramate--alanine ligase
VIQLNDIHKIYFIGIGGIGMSALARYFKSKGCRVSGYDKTETDLTKQLVKEGIAVHYIEDPVAVPKDVQAVVYTPAIPADMKELEYYRQNGYAVMKRSEVLGIISKGSFNICVGGTHGKTTMTTMIAHILRHSGYGCNAFLGGISVNYNTNFWSNERNTCVIEADEYDRSFLALSPDVAVISAMDADHLDIYGTEEALQEAFIAFSTRVKEDGLLLCKFGLKRGSELKAGRQLSYSLQNDNADVYAANIRMQDGSYTFDLVLKDSLLDNITLNMGGMHNVENAVAAVAVAHYLGIDNEKIKAAVEAFRGVKRRFEYIVKNRQVVFIDDYAHHPEELKALIGGAKSLFGGRRCTVVFQPHLYSRTRDLAAAFASSLDLADDIILLPIYPARELPVAGVTSNLILEKMKNVNKRLMSREDLLEFIKDKYVPALNYDLGELLITAGAGDIDTLVQPVKALLEKGVSNKIT